MAFSYLYTYVISAHRLLRGQKLPIGESEHKNVNMHFLSISRRFEPLKPSLVHAPPCTNIILLCTVHGRRSHRISSLNDELALKLYTVGRDTTEMYLG